MSDVKFVSVDADVDIAFVCGCDGTVSRNGRTWDLLCAGCGYAHGHAVISSDDGDCRLPFPVATQGGLRLLLNLCRDWVTEAERAAFLALDAVRALPEPISDAEAAVLRDPLRYARYARYAFVGLGR